MSRIKYHDPVTGEVKYADTALQLPFPSGTANGDIPVWDNDNRVWVVKAPSRLPSAYQEVEWIASNGTQFINTDFYPAGTTRVECVVEKGTAGNNDYQIFGGRNSLNDKTFCLNLAKDTDSFRSDYDSTVGTATAYTGTPVTIDKNGNTTTVNGVTVTATSGSFTSSYPAYLFGWNNGGSAILSTSVVKIMWCKMYANDALRRYFIPCYLKEDDTQIGMYDIITNKFYTNSGSGTFIKGADV